MPAPNRPRPDKFGPDTTHFLKEVIPRGLQMLGMPTEPTGAVSIYKGDSENTIRAFAAYRWTPELERILVDFQKNNPNDILPIGILKVGLLDYWYQLESSRWKTYGKSRVARGDMDMPSLAQYLVYLPVCLGRAVAMGAVIPNDPVEFAQAAAHYDQRLGDHCRLSWNIRPNSIDYTRVITLLDADPPKQLGYMLTRDFEGSPKDIDPSHSIPLEYCLAFPGDVHTTREVAIRATVELIGDVGICGAGQLLHRQAHRHVVL